MGAFLHHAQDGTAATTRCHATFSPALAVVLSHRINRRLQEGVLFYISNENGLSEQWENNGENKGRTKEEKGRTREARENIFNKNNLNMMKKM